MKAVAVATAVSVGVAHGLVDPKGGFGDILKLDGLDFDKFDLGGLFGDKESKDVSKGKVKKEEKKQVALFLQVLLDSEVVPDFCATGEFASSVGWFTLRYGSDSGNGPRIFQSRRGPNGSVNGAPGFPTTFRQQLTVNQMEDIVPDLMSAEDYDMTAFTADFSFLADGNDGGLLQTTLVRDGTANEASSVTVLPPGQNQLDTLACDPGALVAGPTSEAPPQCRANSPVSPGFQKIETCRAAWRFGDKTPIDLVAAFPNETFTAVSANNGETVIEFTDFALMNLDYLSSWDAEVKFTLDGELVDDADSKVKITCGACLPTSGSA
uniref:Uncharacterized protein n=1 Tax=Chromera velia CCMP2878 TaxID=1169474 RepID=A0A0G4HWL1_9ALVE|eukprot:Cvel_9090.t1-p1 / transcript=Cvel_9090.t1 / gene=Cvel_9090 / organism=Chromera_velia_CCMP2878 / gene_product=hypothetical protein / transcript_product=hypothetical protein / location=Cvel_scaffold516:13003-14389(+) / protein_length=322 / sequence_SO=supercontig / SO=protein_coding / is_pseudo=false